MNFENRQPEFEAIVGDTIQKSLELLETEHLRARLGTKTERYIEILTGMLYIPDITGGVIKIEESGRDKVPVLVINQGMALKRNSADILPLPVQQRNATAYSPTWAPVLIEQYRDGQHKVDSPQIQLNDKEAATTQSITSSAGAQAANGTVTRLWLYGAPIITINVDLLKDGEPLSPIVFLHEIDHVRDFIDDPLKIGEEPDLILRHELEGWHVSSEVAKALADMDDYVFTASDNDYAERAMAIDNRRRAALIYPDDEYAVHGYLLAQLKEDGLDLGME